MAEKNESKQHEIPQHGSFEGTPSIASPGNTDPNDAYPEISFVEFINKF